MSAALKLEPWSWVDICPLDELVPNVGVAALAGGQQIAIFRVVTSEADPGSVYAIGNRDLKSGANVLSRGIVGDLQGELVVASPIYKQHYSLQSGRCIESPEYSVRTFPVRVLDGVVQLGLSTSSLRRSSKSQRQKLVVIGDGVAARGVVDELLQIAPDLYDIVILGSADPAIGVNRFKRVVRTRSGRELAYDRVLLATGAMAAPSLDTHAARALGTNGSVTFSDVQEIDALLEAARGHASALVIGGGLLALEAANGLLRQGLKVRVALPDDRLMRGELDPQAASLLKLSLEKRGIEFIGSNAEHAAGALIVMAAGIQPNIELASKIGLRCEHGVLVSDTLQTFDPRIYAVGACVQHRKTTFGLATPLTQQIRVCASHLAELGHSRYQTALGATRLSISGIDAYSAGNIVGDDDDTEDLVYRDTRRGIYKRLVVKGHRVIGVVLYGDVRDANWYFDLIRNGTDVSGKRDRLLFGPDAG